MTMLAADLLAWLVETTVAVSAALLLVLLLRPSTRAVFGARVAYALWLLVPLTLLAASLPAPVRDALLPLSVLAAPDQFAYAVTVGDVQSVAAGNRASSWRWLLPTLLWAGGGLACAASFARQQRRFVAALGTTVRGGDGMLRAQYADGGPVVVGAWSACIVLPADFEARYPAHAGELVLAHERVHLARGDTRFNLLVAALRCAYWFNPLMHWAASRFRHDQELACDAAVLARHPNSRRAYADAMLKTQLAVPGLPVGCHWQSSQSLKERIMMLKRPMPGRTRLRLGASAIAGLMLGASFAVWAMRSTPDVHGTSLPEASNRAIPADAQDTGLADVTREAAGAPHPARLSGALAAAAATRTPADTSTPPPRYPGDARANKQAGRVLLHLLVALDGSVKDVRVVESEPRGVFDAVSIEAAKRWKLQPRIEDGRPVEGWLQVPITFDPEGDPAARDAPLQG